MCEIEDENNIRLDFFLLGKHQKLEVFEIESIRNRILYNLTLNAGSMNFKLEAHVISLINHFNISTFHCYYFN